MNRSFSLQAIDQALITMRGLYDDALTGKRLTDWKVSNDTDTLTGFRQRYAARMTASKAIGNKEELRLQLLDDLRDWIVQLLAMKDYISSRQTDANLSIDIPAAMVRYTARATALDVFLHTLLGSYQSLDGDITFEQAQSELVHLLRGKPEREVFQVVSRVIPGGAEVDNQVTGLLYSLVRKTHTEPSVLQWVTPMNTLLAADDTALRNFAGSQELRDYVAPYLAALIKKALSPEGVEAFDDAFRNTYFAVVNRVINYYQTYRPEAETGKGLGVKGKEPAGTQALNKDTGNPSRLTPHASPKGSIAVPSATGIPAQSDNSSNSTPLPPFDEPEPAQITPLLSSRDAAAITHENLDRLPGSLSTTQPSKKVTGTGLA